jgi:hypothetical protein
METPDMPLEQPTILIIADEPEFARAVMARWQTERIVPAFTLVNSDVCKDDRGNGSGSARKNGKAHDSLPKNGAGHQAKSPAYDLAIVGPLTGASTVSILKTLDSTHRPAIYVCDDAASMQSVRDKLPRILVLRQYEGWLDALTLIAAEALRRNDAVTRLRQAEAAVAVEKHDATLGRYMLEMRHNLNNALTSVLGNSELLLLEPGAISAPVRDQIDTIRNMALRMHEILQRFSSLETEMRCAEEFSPEDTSSAGSVNAGSGKSADKKAATKALAVGR